MGNSMPIRDMDMFATYQRPSSSVLTGAGRPAVPSQGSVQVSPDTCLQLSQMRMSADAIESWRHPVSLPQ